MFTCFVQENLEQNSIEHMLLFQFDQLDMTNASKIHMSLAV